MSSGFFQKLIQRGSGRLPRDLYWAKMRKHVLAKMGRRCYWCGRTLTNFSDIPERKRILIKKHKILWRGSGKVKEGWLATIDHVIPRSRGGSSRANNLVPSCHECNNVRSRFSDPVFKTRKASRRKKYILDCWTVRVKPYRIGLRSLAK